ncbi:MAG: hypothetical protein AB8U54_03985, partial [Rickettsia conorii subsp. raoultii]|uniref:hypothetical protein n=1 Tax=Rickettsia conorii TaxID=781 RepID=UPI003AEF32C2
RILSVYEDIKLSPCGLTGFVGWFSMSFPRKRESRNSLNIDKINLKNKFFVGFTGFPLSRE